MVDGRGWPSDLRPVPPVRVLLDGHIIGTFPPDGEDGGIFEVDTPANVRRR
jgi:hypothetical protein